MPQLRQTIRDMTKSEEDAAKAQAVEQGKLEQKLGDIGDDNKRLKTSIEEKDKTLAEIAREQYALNFTPQVTVYTQNLPDQLFFMNNGKTNVEILMPFCEHLDSLVPRDPNQRALLTPASTMGFSLTDHAKQVVLMNVLGHPDGNVPFACN